MHIPAGIGIAIVILQVSLFWMIGNIPAEVTILIAIQLVMLVGVTWRYRGRPSLRFLIVTVSFITSIVVFQYLSFPLSDEIRREHIPGYPLTELYSKTIDIILFSIWPIVIGGFFLIGTTLFLEEFSSNNTSRYDRQLQLLQDGLKALQEVARHTRDINECRIEMKKMLSDILSFQDTKVTTALGEIRMVGASVIEAIRVMAINATDEFGKALLARANQICLDISPEAVKLQGSMSDLRGTLVDVRDRINGDIGTIVEQFRRLNAEISDVGKNSQAVCNGFQEFSNAHKGSIDLMVADMTLAKDKMCKLANDVSKMRSGFEAQARKDLECMEDMFKKHLLHSAEKVIELQSQLTNLCTTLCECLQRARGGP